MEKKTLEKFILKKKPTANTISNDLIIFEKFDDDKLRKYLKALEKCKAYTNKNEIAKHAAIRYTNQRRSKKNKDNKIKEEKFDVNFVEKIVKIEDDASDKYKKLLKSIKKKAMKHGVELDDKQLNKLHNKIIKYELKKKNKIILV